MTRRGASGARERLAQRVRALLAGEVPASEVSMFGGRAFMVDGRMVVSAGSDGDLLVRVGAERHDEFVCDNGASTAKMGAGRTMGPGWIRVGASAVASDVGLARWVRRALEHRRGDASGGGSGRRRRATPAGGT